MDTQILEAIARNPNFEDKELLKEIAELFKDRPEAIQYLYLFGQLCEVADDMVDGDITVREGVEKVGLLRQQLSVCPYWLSNWQHLWMTERLIHHQYMNMVQWERSSEEWKRRDARALSHCAYNMFFAVVMLEFGDDALAKIADRFRTHAHLLHLNDPELV